MTDDPHNTLQDTLDQCMDWPCTYTFKFIAPKQQVPVLMELFKGCDVSTRESGKGTYVSVTANMSMETSADVVAVYKKAATIEGVISL